MCHVALFDTTPNLYKHSLAQTSCHHALGNPAGGIGTGTVHFG